MEFKLKQSCQLDPVNGVEIEFDIVRVRLSKSNKLFSRNIFVTISVKGEKRKVYRILKGASTERLTGSEVLVSYSTFKHLETKEDADFEIKVSNFWERNFLFFFHNPDPRKRHQVFMDFVVIGAGFVVSIIEMLHFFGIKP
jgi:hypothetical protein